MVQRANPEDFEEIIAFANSVFLQNGKPEDFSKLVPKLYAPTLNSANQHYVIKQKGQISGCLCVHPVTLALGNKSLKAACIGSVAVAPAHRGKGYMQQMLHTANQDLLQAGYDIAFLGGQRQRYERFGYTPSATLSVFSLNRANLKYLDTKVPAVTLVPLQEKSEYLQKAIALHSKLSLKAERNPKHFLSILKTWDATPLAILKNGHFAGYCSFTRSATSQPTIQELVFEDDSILPGFCQAILMYSSCDHLEIIFPANQVPASRFFTSVCEEYSIRQDGSYYILCFKNVIEAALILSCSQKELEDGEIILEIEQERIAIKIKNNIPTVTYSSSVPPTLMLSRSAATTLLFSSAGTVMHESQYLPTSWLPLPLCAPLPDRC